jgi:glycosyltransferase involved in cell wall biosynthesis/peptidoglycan/xylan/chitin deacetylase (PgdA/CDA1 family)
MMKNKQSLHKNPARFGPGPAAIAGRTAIKESGLKLAAHLSALINDTRGNRYPDRFGILMYHRVSAVTPNLPQPTTNVTGDQFRKQLCGLLNRGYVFWPLRKLIDFRTRGEPIPSFVTAITFDDGFGGIYHHAWPVMREFNLPATIFLNTAYLDSEEPMPFDYWGIAHAKVASPNAYRSLTVAQCREMADSGLIDLGSHSHTHQDFRGRPEALEQDVRLSLARLKSLFEKVDITFAFPYGTPQMGYADPEMIAAVKRTGVICALNTGSNVIEPQSDPFHWGRFNVFSWDTAATLAAKLNSWYSWAPHLWKRLSGSSGSLQAAAKNRSRARNYGARRPAPVSLEPIRQGTARGTITDDKDNDVISVVVPTYNRAEWVGDAINSLLVQKTRGRFTYEILIVDNRSSDNTKEVVTGFTRNNTVPVRYLFNPKPGDAPTRNVGLAHAKGNWFAFFDDDQLAEPDWLYELWHTARTRDAKIVGGAVVLDLPQAQLRELGPFCREVLREIDLYDQVHPMVGSQLPGTCNALVARTVFTRLGRFDESMSSGGSDSLLFYKARQAGFPMWYAPRALIHHRIPKNRLTASYFRWEALSGGVGRAMYFDLPYKGRCALLVFGAARLFQAIVLHIPRMLWAHLKGDSGAVLGRKIRIWRAEGYARKTLAVFFPRLFSQKDLFQRFEFRSGRTIGTSDDKTKRSKKPSRQSVS